MRKTIPLIVLCCVPTLCFATYTEDGSKSLEFQVVTRDGKPVEGAEVQLLWPYQAPDEGEPLEAGRRETVTDGKGWFRFEVAGLVRKVDTYLLLVRKAGYSIGWKTIFTNREPIILSPVSSFSANVVDVNGNSVTNANVEVLNVFLKRIEKDIGGEMLKPSALLSFMRTKTDADGRFAFDVFPEGAKLQFSISSEGYATFYTYQVSEEVYYPEKGFPHPVTGEPLKIPYRKPVGSDYTIGMTEVRLVLKPEATIQGIVRDKGSGKPLAGLPLSLFLDSGSGISSVHYHPKMPCTTDAEGRFAYLGLEKGTYTLVFESKEHACAADSLLITVAEGQHRRDVALELAHGGTLDLRLVDSRDHRPVKKCVVYIERPKLLAESRVLTTDENGRLFRHLIPGAYKITAFQKQGYGRVLRQHDFVIKDGLPTSVSLELTEYPKTKVRVVGPKGKPVRNLAVRVLQRERDCHYETDVWRGETANGFTLWCQSPAERTQVVVQASDAANNLVTISSITVPGKDVRLTLRRGLTVAGKVQDQNDEPLPYLNVHAIGRIQKGDVDFKCQLGSRLSSLWTDSKGRFSIHGIPRSKWLSDITVVTMPKRYTSAVIPVDPTQAVDNVVTLPVLTLRERNRPVRVTL